MKPLPRRLFVEYLENRTIPSASPWLNPGDLTISFVPDGTATGAGASDLTATFGAATATVWETQILQAFQTWAADANINLAVVPDGGEPLGTSGLPQGDPRFGDIRIAAAPLGNPATAGLAETVVANGSSGTWQGDVIFNSNAPITVGGVGGTYNLFSVALHEAGHSLGFSDETTNPSSVMYATYEPNTGLMPADIAAIQSLYGLPTGDPFGSGVTATVTSTAFDLTRHGNLSDVDGDIAQIGGAQVFQFTTPIASTGINGLTVNVQAAGISLFTPHVTILNSAGNPVASGVAASPLSNSVSVTLPNYSPLTTYYVRVQGADTSVFSSGAYNLQLNYSQTYGNSFNLGARFLNTSLSQNHSIVTAQDLGFSDTTYATEFTAVGSLTNSQTTDWYRITPTSLTSFTGTLTVGVVGIDASGLLPIVTVYNSAGQQMQAAVVANENGTFTVQLAGQQTGAHYYLQVSAANPSGANATGKYAVWSDLSQIAPTTFTLLASSTLSAATSATASTLTISDTRLIQFSLSAAAATAGTEGVEMTIVGANGAVLLNLDATAGSPLVTGSVWLDAGSYTVIFTAITVNSAPISTLSFALAFYDLTDPDDPAPVDPTSPPPPCPTPPDPVVIVVSPPSPLPPGS